MNRERIPHDDPDYIGKLFKQVEDEQKELEELRKFRNEVCAALAAEGPHDIEHLLATAMLGKHTTVIGRAALTNHHNLRRNLRTYISSLHNLTALVDIAPLARDCYEAVIVNLQALADDKLPPALTAYMEKNK